MKTETLLGLDPNGFHKIATHKWGDPLRAGVPVICVHGLTRNGRDFDELAKRLSARGPVYCPDMAGRGLSDDLPNPQDYNYMQYCADATALIARTGASQVDWVGTSMGGILGMMLAAQPGSPIRQLVLNDVGAVIPMAALKRVHLLVNSFPVFDTMAELESCLRQKCAPWGRLAEAQVHHLAQTGFRKTADGKLTLAYDPRLATVFPVPETDVILWDVYDKITCPTLLIRGAQSDLLTKETAQEMTQRGPRASLVEIEEAGHAPALMDEAQIKLIEDFLKG